MITCSVASRYCLYCPKHGPKAGCRNTPLPERPFSLALSTDYKSYVITLQPRVAGGFRSHFAGGGGGSDTFIIMSAGDNILQACDPTETTLQFSKRSHEVLSRSWRKNGHVDHVRRELWPLPARETTPAVAETPPRHL